jgi:hypothetical protein
MKEISIMGRCEIYYTSTSIKIISVEVLNGLDVYRLPAMILSRNSSEKELTTAIKKSLASGTPKTNERSDLHHKRHFDDLALSLQEYSLESLHRNSLGFTIEKTSNHYRIYKQKWIPRCGIVAEHTKRAPLIANEKRLIKKLIILSKQSQTNNLVS